MERISTPDNRELKVWVAEAIQQQGPKISARKVHAHLTERGIACSYTIVARYAKWEKKQQKVRSRTVEDKVDYGVFLANVQAINPELAKALEAIQQKQNARSTSRR